MHTDANIELRRPWYGCGMSTKILDMIGTHLAVICLTDGNASTASPLYGMNDANTGQGLTVPSCLVLGIRGLLQDYIHGHENR